MRGIIPRILRTAGLAALCPSLLACASEEEKICEKMMKLRGKEISEAKVKTCVAEGMLQKEEHPKRYACMVKCIEEAEDKKGARACLAGCRPKRSSAASARSTRSTRSSRSSTASRLSRVPAAKRKRWIRECLSSCRHHLRSKSSSRAVRQAGARAAGRCAGRCMKRKMRGY